MKKSITIVFIASIVNMLFAIITNFLLPKYLSIESYGYYKEFQLYANYVGITHLGFADGVYLKYGGKTLENIDTKEILDTTASIRNLQFFLTIIFVGISLMFHNKLALMLSLSCFPINMVSYYKNVYQATGKFKKYSIIQVLVPFFSFLMNIVLLLVIRTDQYFYYILVTIMANALVYFYLERNFHILFKRVFSLSIKVSLVKENIVSGLPLLVGNIASLLITSIDRWFIQLVMEIKYFSYYSFAVSVENLFNVSTSAITTTLYNYLCKNKNEEKIIKVKSFCILIATYIIAIAFPVKYIVTTWIEKYIPSICCLFVLISAHMFYFVIKAVYVNLYKANGQQKHYFFQILVVLGIAAISNIILYFAVEQSINSVAYASLLTAFIWYVICYIELKKIRGTRTELLQLLICICVYLFCGIKINNAVVGLSVYLVFSNIVIYFLNRTTYLEFWKSAFNYIFIRK